MEENKATINPMNQETVIAVPDYQQVDGRNAYASAITEITLGTPKLAVNQKMEIAAQIWQKDADGQPTLALELPVHQVLDLGIIVTQTMLHFKEAYRFPKMYPENQPVLARVGLQGSAMTVQVNEENPEVVADLKKFDQALGNLGELTGERLRVLTRLINELAEY